MTYETVLTELPPDEAAAQPAAGRAMLTFGDATFTAPATSFQELKRASEYRWPSQDRIGQRPIRQYVGRGGDSVDLNGVLFPAFAGGAQMLAALRSLAEAGTPRLLAAGTGEVFGRYVLVRIEEARTRVFRDGAPRRVAWRLRFERYGDDTPGGALNTLAAASAESGDARAVIDAIEAAKAAGASPQEILAAAKRAGGQA